MVSDEELQQVLGDEPTPDFAAEVAEELRRLLDRLPEEELRRIAVWKMEGWTVEQSARELDCVSRTVKRRLQVIRNYWNEEDAS